VLINSRGAINGNVAHEPCAARCQRDQSPRDLNLVDRLTAASLNVLSQQLPFAAYS